MDQKAATMLHKKVCPYEYQCRATDCMECMKLHEKVDGLEADQTDKVNTVLDKDV